MNRLASILKLLFFANLFFNNLKVIAAFKAKYSENCVQPSTFMVSILGNSSNLRNACAGIASTYPSVFPFILPMLEYREISSNRELNSNSLSQACELNNRPFGIDLSTMDEDFLSNLDEKEVKAIIERTRARISSAAQFVHLKWGSVDEGIVELFLAQNISVLEPLVSPDIVKASEFIGELEVDSSQSAGESYIIALNAKFALPILTDFTRKFSDLTLVDPFACIGDVAEAKMDEKAEPVSAPNQVEDITPLSTSETDNPAGQVVTVTESRNNQETINEETINDTNIENEIMASPFQTKEVSSSSTPSEENTFLFNEKINSKKPIHHHTDRPYLPHADKGKKEIAIDSSYLSVLFSIAFSVTLIIPVLMVFRKSSRSY